MHSDKELQGARVKINTTCKATDEKELYVSTVQLSKATHTLITLGEAIEWFEAISRKKMPRSWGCIPTFDFISVGIRLPTFPSALGLGYGPYRAEFVVDGLYRQRA